MTKAHARGYYYERKVAAEYAQELDLPVERRGNAGAKLDTGDLRGIPNHVGQVKGWKDFMSAIRQGPTDAEQQRLNAGVDYGFTVVVTQRGILRVILTIPQHCRYIRRTL